MTPLAFSLVLLVPITSFVLVIAVIEWLGRRKDRQTLNRAV